MLHQILGGGREDGGEGVGSDLRKFSGGGGGRGEGDDIPRRRKGKEEP